MPNEIRWQVYLAGEIHTDWRQEVQRLVEARMLPVTLSWPILDHAASDQCGERILGAEDKGFWKDHKASKINSLRTRRLIQAADLVVIRFGPEYKQWNAAFEAGLACAWGKPFIVYHPPELTHALKEVDAQALAVVQNSTQLVDILEYNSQ